MVDIGRRELWGEMQQKAGSEEACSYVISIIHEMYFRSTSAETITKRGTS
jgi:hypothetical protein